jgi:hypothetical protein
VADTREARDVRDLTLGEVATSRRLLVVIVLLVVFAVGALVVFFIRPGADGPGGNSRSCGKSAAYSCEDFENPKGGG